MKGSTIYSVAGKFEEECLSADEVKCFTEINEDGIDLSLHLPVFFHDCEKSEDVVIALTPFFEASLIFWVRT